MAKKLSLKERRFVDFLVTMGHVGDAYKEAYNSKSKYKSTLAAQGRRVAERPHVARAIDKQMSRFRRDLKVSIDEITKELRETIECAKRDGDHNVRRLAAMDLAKLHGLVVDKSEVTGSVNLNKKRKEIAQRFIDRMKNKHASG